MNSDPFSDVLGAKRGSAKMQRRGCILSWGEPSLRAEVFADDLSITFLNSSRQPIRLSATAAERALQEHGLIPELEQEGLTLTVSQQMSLLDLLQGTVRHKTRPSSPLEQ